MVICGGGNLAHLAVAFFGFRHEIRINILTTRPQDFKTMCIAAHTEDTAWKRRGEVAGKINKVSDKPSEVVPGSQIVLLCVPYFKMFELAGRIFPFCDKHTAIGSLYGVGGIDWIIYTHWTRHFRNNYMTVFTLQDPPANCKVRERGKSVDVLGCRNILYFFLVFPLDY